MKVRAEFYSRSREIVGASSLDVVLLDNATVLGLVEKLCGDYPPLRDFRNSMLFGIGVEFVDEQRVLREGEVVAIMPPVQGG